LSISIRLSGPARPGDGRSRSIVRYSAVSKEPGAAATLVIAAKTSGTGGSAGESASIHAATSSRSPTLSAAAMPMNHGIPAVRSGSAATAGNQNRRAA
jgi:hypothetical protein